MKINLSGISKSDVDASLLTRTGQLTAANIDSTRQGQINIALVDEKTSRNLNNTYAGNDYATDVLSFNYNEGEELGDIAICLPIALAQAKAVGNSLEDELVLLTVHGVMHVMGLDHQNESSQAGFARQQNAIVKMLGQKNRDYQWSP